MSTPVVFYTDEKNPEALPVPVTVAPPRKRPGFCGWILRFLATFFGTLFIINVITQGSISRGLSHGCRGNQDINGGGDHHQHPFPPIEKWKPFHGTTHFELDPSDASGLTVKGSKAFGKVVFETSKLSDKIVVDLEIKTNKKDKDHQVCVKEQDGYLTIDTPNTGKLETYTSAKIQIPSNIIGTFGLPAFKVEAPRHMVDISGLPESLEIGDLTIRLAKGFIKTGPVHTNVTQLTVADGALKGTLTHARYDTSIDVAHGNVTIDMTKISTGNEGETKVHLGNGHLDGTLSVYNSTSIDVARGSIYVTVDFQSSDIRAELNTRIASGPSRVYVNSIAAERTFDSYHNSVSGDQLITYPSNFQGTVDARGIAGDIKLEGKDLAVEKVIGGMVGKQGDSQRNSISVKAVKGALDILVGDEP